MGAKDARFKNAFSYVEDTLKFSDNGLSRSHKHCLDTPGHGHGSPSHSLSHYLPEIPRFSMSD